MLLKLEALVYPIARNSISGSRRSLRRLHVSAAAAAASATAAAAAAAARVAVVAGLWKINCTSTALPPLLLAMRICHLHNVCVWTMSVCVCVRVCVRRRKKKQLRKSICKFYTYDSFLLSMPPPLMFLFADFLAVAACLFDAMGQLLLPINNYH